ncbi:hypothetical protein [Massiliimalia timonensis]|uniref:hypothetical protein n=1 Tax=Massiliimalia timonensis TaxID=1987501 RepID=UPI000B8B017A|nr:hypothetical protein [Massiliimalia timonensis]
MKHKLSTKCVILISVISSVVVLAILFAIVYKIDQYKEEEPLLSKEEYIGSTWHLDGLDLDFYVYSADDASSIIKYCDRDAAAICYMKIDGKLRPVELSGVTPPFHRFIITAIPNLNPQDWENYHRTESETGQIDPTALEFISGDFVKKSNNLFVLTIEYTGMNYLESKEWEQLIGKKLELRRVE